MENVNSVLILGLTAVVSLYSASYLNQLWNARRAISKIPTIGGSGILSSYQGAYKMIFSARDMIQEGYTKYRGATFKIAGITKWTVFITKPEAIDELRKAPEEHLSFRHAFAESIQSVHTLGPEVRHDSYHVEVLKTNLNRSLANCFPDVIDEIEAAFEEHIPPTEDWTDVVALPTIMKIVSRSSNRLFVGLPLCRNPAYWNLNINFAVDVVQAAFTINMFPNSLKPLVARFFTNIEAKKQQAMNYLRPLIEERLEREAEDGKDWFGKPNDVLSWCIDMAEGDQRTIRDLTMRILTINFAATHTTSMAFSQVLFNLAANPSYVPELRQEIETIIDEHRYTRESLHNMMKVDSFVKETLRIGGIFSGTMERKVMKDFTFSDGTTVPKGNNIAVANYAIHHDEQIYSGPSVFDGFRFSRMRERSATELGKHQLASLSHDYIAFGYGKHACPGRAFAIDELKAFLVHTLLNYDVAFKNNGPRPVDPAFGLFISPDPKVSVMFRKRRNTSNSNAAL